MAMCFCGIRALVKTSAGIRLVLITDGEQCPTYVFAEEVVLDVDVFRPAVAVRVVTEGDAGLVVRVQRGERADTMSPVSYVSSPPDGLLHCFSAASAAAMLSLYCGLSGGLLYCQLTSAPHKWAE
jgi:hypothetical protein